MRRWWKLLLLILPLVGMGWCAGDLFLFQRGVGLEGPDGVKWRYRPGSWVTSVTGAQCTTLGSTVHCRAAVPPSAYLLAHEWRHTEQQRGQFVPWWVVQYYAGAKTQREADAHNFGCARRNDPYWKRIEAVVARLRVGPVSDTPAAIITCP